jgi:uncharacterized protein (TIGR02217 family)
MAFLETPSFPQLLARGLSCGPAFSTRVVVLRSGREQRNANWSRVRWRADAASAVRTQTDFAALEEFFYAVGGRLHGFRVRDPGDYRHSDAGGSPILLPLDSAYDATGTAGVGYGVPVYQLAKQYAAGSLAHNRWIEKPVSGGIALTRAGSPVTLGASAGNAAVDATTGRVTFVADQSRSITTHTPGADHVMALASALSPNVTVGQRVYIAGCGGADAATLNSLSHEVTNISGANVTIATATTGLTITGGTLYLYPQSSEALAWTGTFDVPCRFDVDALDRQMLTRQISGEYLMQALSIPLVEVRL